MTQTLAVFPEHFRADLSPSAARELFKKTVKLVEIETFTYCNRTCFFCPNSSLPFRQDKKNNRLMDEQLYLRILADLSSIDYRGNVTWSRYNEPLAEQDLFLLRIRQAREALPYAFLYAHSNGDFLTRDYLELLADAGFNGLAIQTYLGNDERYNEPKMLARQEQQAKKLDLELGDWIINSPGVRKFRRLKYDRMQVVIDARNFDQIGTDRGGLVQLNVQVRRRSPCFIPFEGMYIDYNGSVVPCCNIRSDVEEHKKYVVSDLSTGVSIFDAYVALNGWRKSLLQYGPKKAPCDTCNYEQLPYNEKLERQLDQLAAAYFPSNPG